MNSAHRKSKVIFTAVTVFAVLVVLRAQSPVTVTPSNPTILVGATQQFNAAGAFVPTAVAGGGWHTCLLLSDRTVSCMGRNSQGQLGNGTFTGSLTPGPVAGVANAVSLQSGSEHNCALIADGTMQCWGTNYTGQIGDGTMGGATVTPVQVHNMTNAIALGVGGFHTCAVLSDHTVECWGRNQDGQLGNGDSTTDTSLPGPVTGLGPVAALSGGGYHTCAVMPDNTVRCWGRNDDGQLGNGTRTSSSTPVTVSGLTGLVALSAGGYHTCALMQDRTVQCWGQNYLGQLGVPPGPIYVSTTPMTVPDVNNVVALNSGFYNTCATLADGTVRCWGYNIYGEVGDGTVSNSSTPVAVGGITNPQAVAVGSFHSCALMQNTSVRCWGENDFGELGNGTGTNSPTPVTVTGTGLAWTSSSPSVATINAGGLATAVARGTTLISETDGFGNSASTTLTVKQMLALSVAEQGTGSGTVTSSPAGINCGASCSSTYLSDSQVTLTAVPAANSTVAGWVGCDVVSGSTCTVTMTAARTVTVTFNLKVFSLAVSKTGMGSGTVTSSPSGISCGTTCSAPYVIGSTVTLTAAPALGSVFLNGWSGCDAVSGTLGEQCTVVMSAAKSVTANFVVGLQ